MIVLGFDETNNGFGLKCFNENHQSNLIITGYLASDLPMKNYQRPSNEVKGKLFDGNRNLQSALRRGRDYLSKHPDFLYTSVSKELQRVKPIELLHAEAVALLTTNFFLRYSLNPNETKVIMDERDGKNPSNKINQLLDLWLKKTGINIIHKSMKSAADNVYSVRKADMVGYYLTAIHFLGYNHKWPYRSRRVSFNRLEKDITLFQENNGNRQFDYRN